MNKNLIIGIILILIIAGAGWFFLKSRSTPVLPTEEMTENATIQSGESEAESPSPEAMVESTGSTAAKGEKAFTVTGSNFKFDTPEIRVKKGDTVKITFKNSGGFHNFVIDEFNVATKQANGPSEETVTFIADKAGEFAFYCSVGKHRSMGMEGKFIVQ